MTDETQDTIPVEKTDPPKKRQRRARPVKGSRGEVCPHCGTASNHHGRIKTENGRVSMQCANVGVTGWAKDDCGLHWWADPTDFDKALKREK